MQEKHNLIIGIVVTIFVFLAVGFFIVLLIAFINQKKRKYIEEKELMQAKFNQALLQAQIEIQENTFNNISGEIHDNVGQLLSLVKIQLNIIEQNEVLDKVLLKSAKENVGKVMADLRDIAKSLSSERVRSLSIDAVVRNEIEQISKISSSKFEILIDGKERRIDEQKKVILFRIMQECLHNCIKHADASVISIYIGYLPGNLLVSITDNGKGFSMDEVSKTNDGLGLLNIKMRAALTGGFSTIESVLNSGTTIKITIPYE